MPRLTCSCFTLKNPDKEEEFREQYIATAQTSDETLQIQRQKLDSAPTQKAPPKKTSRRPAPFARKRPTTAEAQEKKDKWVVWCCCQEIENGELQNKLNALKVLQDFSDLKPHAIIPHLDRVNYFKI